VTGAGGGAVVDGTAVGVPISTLLALGSVVGVDGGTQDRDSTEHLLYQAVATSPGQVTLACTHLVAVPTPHWAVSMVVAGSPPAELELSRDLAGSAVTVVRLGGRIARAAAGRGRPVPMPRRTSCCRAPGEPWCSQARTGSRRPSRSRTW